MAYIDGNPKNKAEIKRWLAEGRRVTVYAPGLGSVPENGTATVEGPHYPQPHRWYGTATIRDGCVVSVK